MQFVWAKISIFMLTCTLTTNMSNFKVESCPAIAQMLTTSNLERKTALYQMNCFVCYDIC